MTSHGAGRRAVIAAPKFFALDVQALEDQGDIRGGGGSQGSLYSLQWPDGRATYFSLNPASLF